MEEFFAYAFFGALSSNIRIVGAIVMVAAYLCLLVKGIREKQIKKYFNYLCIGAVIFFVFFALLTPRLWAVDRKSAIASLSPEHWILLTSGFWNKICQIFSRLWATVMTFANYSYWQGSSLFLGRYYRSNELPIYYLPVWILVTTPVCYSVFAGVGTIGSISSVISPRRKKWSNKQFGMTFLLLLLVIPFAYIIIFRPSLYNGWRHFYFIYAVIILLSVWGVQFLLEWLSGKKWCVCILGTITVCSLCLTITWIIRNHPYEYVYFNMPVHDFIIEKMEKDYWSVSERDCLEYICKTDTRENITYFSYSGKNELMLSKADSNRLNLVSTNEVTEADYYLHFPGYSMEKDEFPHRGLFEEVYSTQVDGEKISAVFKRINQIVYENQIQQRNQNLYYQIAGIDWKRAENGKSIVGILKKLCLQIELQ